MRTLNIQKQIIHPERKDIPELKRLWCNCFPEDQEGFCDFYFQHIFKPERTLMVYNGYSCESALYWFEAYYKGADEQIYPFWYIYATATLPRYRGQHNLKHLLEKCELLARQAGQQGVLVVAVRELQEVYDAYGYERLSGFETLEAKVKNKSDKLLAVAKEAHIDWKRNQNFAWFYSLREKYLDQMGNAFYWKNEDYEFIHKMYASGLFGAEILGCCFEEKEYYAVCVWEEEKRHLVIKETNFPGKQIAVLIGSLIVYYNKLESITFLSHTNAIKEAGIIERSFLCEGQSSIVDSLCWKHSYYGHYHLNEAFLDSKQLSEAYLNLAAD